MEKIELQEIIDACTEVESEYIKLYRPLLGYEDSVNFYRGIDDSLEEALDELETDIGMKIPADLLQVYLISNGGKYFDINLFSLTISRTDEAGLYYQNFKSDLRAMYDVPKDMLIIGETDDNLLVLLGIDDENYYYYCTWDKDTRAIDVEYVYLVELLMYEIDYHTGAFSFDEEVEEEQTEEEIDE